MNDNVPYSEGKVCVCCKDAVFSCRCCDAQIWMDVSEPLAAGLEMPWVSDLVRHCPQCNQPSRLMVTCWSDFNLSERSKLEKIFQESS